MKLIKHAVPVVDQTSTSVKNGVDGQQPVQRRSDELTIRVRVIDCLLADIRAQIERLEREHTHLKEVREELVRMQPKKNGPSLRNVSLKKRGVRVRVEAAASTHPAMRES